jgi:type II secretory pathway component HofQ
MRVYLPATTGVLRRLVDKGELGPPLTAFAVTPSLREWYTEGDLEELEYAALLEAARGSLRLLDEDPTSARRRVVIAADVPDASAEARPDLDRAVVRVTTAVPLRLVAAVHVDGPDAEEAVRAAADAVLEADLGSEDAKFVLDEAEGHELLWYASQEVGPLLDLL